MATSEESLNPNDRNERLWHESHTTNVSDESKNAYQSTSSSRGSSSSQVNVNDTERIISGVGGGALAAYGLTRGDWLGAGLAILGASLLYRGTTGYCGMYDAIGVDTSEKQNMTSVKGNVGVKVEKSVTINASAEELYSFWRKFENLPKFMTHLEEVREIDHSRSHWKAKAPLGTTVEWDAEIISDTPNQMISWRSIEGADVDNAGSVHFRPSASGRGTVVKVSLKYDPPAGKLGAAVAWLTGEEPSVQVEEDLRRFKRLMETDEIPTIEGQSAGRAKSTSKYDTKE
jgi:uncharacterized membrane protein